MNYLYLYLIAAACAIIPLGIYYLIRRYYLKKNETVAPKKLKICYLVIAAITICFLFITIYHINPAMKAATGNPQDHFNPNVGCLFLEGVPYGSNKGLNFLAWFGDALFFPAAAFVCLVAIWPFRTGKLFNKWLGLPLIGLSFIFLFNLCNAETGNCNLTYQNAFLAMSVGLVLSLSILQFIRHRQEAKNMNWKECINMVGFFLIAFIAFLPVSTFSTLNSIDAIVFGVPEYTLRVYDLNELHRCVIYLGIIFFILVYFLFRNTDRRVKKVLVLIISLGALRVFFGQYNATLMFPFKADGSITCNVTALPIHLCHTALFVVPICVAFNLKKLFYFTYFINVFGAFCAILMPNNGEFINIYHPEVMVFWYNHLVAAFIPLLTIALRIFPKAKFKQLLWSLGFFAVYFVFIMFMNAWLSNYVEGGTDYLFINNDFILSKIFNEKTCEQILGVTWEWTWGDLHFVLRPLYQGIFFLGYVIITFLMWFVYGLFFRIADAHYDLHCLLVISKKEHISMKLRRTKEDEKDLINHDDVRLVFDNFSKRYGNSEVLSANKVTLEVKGGQIFGFLGPNGAGKSTCIKSAIGIQPVTEGNIYVCGYDVGTQPVETKRLIGYVPDHYALYEKLTGREYINYIADLYGVSKEDRDRRITKFVDLFELQQAFDNRMQTYSHGMKQKVTIIAALIHNPKVWILDEPLTGLDPQSIFQVKQCMIKHAEKGNVVFFSSHIIDVVEKLCTDIAIIKKGQIVYQASMKKVHKDHPEGLETFYLSSIRDNGDLDD